MKCQKNVFSFLNWWKTIIQRNGTIFVANVSVVIYIWHKYLFIIWCFLLESANIIRLFDLLNVNSKWNIHSKNHLFTLNFNKINYKFYIFYEGEFYYLNLLIDHMFMVYRISISYLLLLFYDKLSFMNKYLRINKVLVILQTKCKGKKIILLFF